MKSYKIIQIPSKDNEFIAIVQGEVQTNEGIISNFGIATKKAESTDDVEKLLEIAKEKSTKSIENTPSRAIPHSYQNNQNVQVDKASNQQKQFNHSTEKDISDKQIELILKLAKDSDKAEAVSNNKFNKNIQSLNQKEADEVIKHFMNK